MAVNYDDERFQQVEDERQEQLNQYNQTYDNLVAEREDLTNQQQGLVDKWQQTQNENLDKQLQFQQDLINQQKAETQKAYENEAKSAYTDYQKEVDRYGVSREQQVANGLNNTGYSESSKVSMYNTYQNRLATAKQSMDKAYLEFDNAIREAQLTNDVTKAENALTALEQKLNISLEGFNYKDTATQNKLNWQYQINNTYDNRYQNVLDQINYENEVAEQIRQYNEQMKLQKEQLEYQKEQDRIAQQQWEKEYALAKQQAIDLNDGDGKKGEGSTNVPDYNTINDVILKCASNPAYRSNQYNMQSEIAKGINNALNSGKITEKQAEELLNKMESAWNGTLSNVKNGGGTQSYGSGGGGSR